MKHYLKILFVFVPVLAKELSSHIFEQLHLTLRLWWFLLTRKTFLRGVPMTFSFTFKGKRFPLVFESPIDVAVLSEIFVLKEYEWKPNFEVTTILDLGAHWGDSALYYSLTYPHAKIFAVEPTPREFKRLQKNAALVPNLVPIQGALGAATGSISLFVSESSLGNSFSRRSPSDKEILVDTFSLQDLCGKAGVEKFDLIKFDIEGAESIIFADSNNLKYAKSFIGEIHLDLMSVTVEEIRHYFSGWSFSEKTLSSQRSIVTAETA